MSKILQHLQEIFQKFRGTFEVPVKRIYRVFILSCLFLFFFHFLSVSASDEPLTGPSNRGDTGLMEIPTARVIKKNRYRVGAGQVDPYRFYYIVISPLDRLEITGRVTEILGVKAKPHDPKWRGYGNYKDKAIDFKYKFLEEGKYTPAISLGIMDPHGTRLYPSQYLVASKQIYPFDFTLGFGNGRFGKRPLSSEDEEFKIEMFQTPKDWLKDGQFFWGIQWAISDKYALMMEFNPIKYQRQTRDPAHDKYFREQVSSRYNFGFRWKPFKWAEIDTTYQRGNQLGVNFSMAFDIGNPLIPIYDHPYKEKERDRENPLSKRLINALHASGFSNIGVDMQGYDLWIEAQNDTYFYSTRAIGVILKIVNDIVPLITRNEEQKVHIVLTDNLIPVIQYTTTRADIMELYRGKLTLNEFYYLSKVNTDVLEIPDLKREHRKYFDYGIKPAFRMFLNDPSGFFKYRLGVYLWGSLNLWKGGSFIGGIEGFPWNTVSTSNEPLSKPVRSDLVPYQEKNVTLGRLMYNHILKTEHELYGKFAAGLLEIQYAGFDGEVAMPLNKGRFMVGLGSSVVRKRDVDNVFKLSSEYKNTYTTAFLNTRLNIPELEVSIDVKAGRFLAGDKGARFTISKFINGVTLSAWYSTTNTSIFRDRFNRGYHDKGVALTIPLRLFKGSDSKTVFDYAITPWTRDVAQDIYHHTNLFDFMGRNTKIYLDVDRNKVYR